MVAFLASVALNLASVCCVNL